MAILLGEEVAVRRLARTLLPRPMKRSDYAGLCGAPDTAAVEIGEYHNALYLELRDPVALAYNGHFYLRRTCDQLVLCNEGLRIRQPDDRSRGLGLQMFYRQVRQAAALGVNRIELCAGRGPDENGYYTWPRYGFDAMLTSDVCHSLPRGLCGAQSILELFETAEGRAWWREHGVTIDVSFDLSPNSRSWQALMSYVAERMARHSAGRQSGPKTNLEARLMLT